ncbi:MAG TPA: sterol desaturase family protein [Ferruginibacter sp.]|nr:sterol desaturase family protein [Ferruginibacter sp.]HRO17424.1 sterol desaturase family protein [Ferruginibacter sp.]HRQ20934.1 sterol desaturase family protein [Ferruginibacter sp.]
MAFQKIHNKGQAQLFKNQYLEYLTKTHPLIIWGIYTPVIVYMCYYSYTELSFTGWTVLMVFLAGMFFWSFTEYIMHRFVFHSHPKSERGKRIAYVMHGNHHEFPRDKERLFMPAVPSVLLASIFFSLFYLAMGKFAFSFFPGFMLGYLMYGSMHYAIHAWNPPFKWMKGLWRNHHLHHYKHEDLGFGVSSTLWDHVFGTMFDLKKEKEDKEKVRELMY